MIQKSGTYLGVGIYSYLVAVARFGFAALDSIVNSGISCNSAALKLYCSHTKLKRVPLTLTGFTEWVRSP